MDKPYVDAGAADRLVSTEKAIENAIADTAQLMFGMTQARLDLSITVVVGEDGTGRASQAALAETRCALVRARWAPRKAG